MQKTDEYDIPYATSSDFVYTYPDIDKQQAERIERIFKDAKVPPGNPDVNDILARIAEVGPPQIQTLRNDRFRVEGSGRAWDIGPLTTDRNQSSKTDLATPDGNGHVRITKAGWYDLWVSSTPFNRPGSYYIVSISAPGQGGVEGITPGQAWGTHANLPKHWLDAGARVKFGCVIDTTADVTSTVKIQYHGNRKN